MYPPRINKRRISSTVFTLQHTFQNNQDVLKSKVYYLCILKGLNQIHEGSSAIKEMSIFYILLWQMYPGAATYSQIYHKSQRQTL